MALKSFYENLEDIPEGMENLYTQTDEGGKYNALEIEGKVDKSRLNEFRDNNIQLRKDIEDQELKTNDALNKIEEYENSMNDLKSKFEGIDLEEWKTLQDEKRAMADKELIETGEVDSLIEKRVQEVLDVKTKEILSMQSAHDNRVLDLEKDLQTRNSQLNKLLVDNEITKFSAEHGIRSSALEDVLHRGRGIFKVEDDIAIAFDDSGRKLYGDDAVTPLTISGWLGGLTETAPHLFEVSTGASAVQQVIEKPQVVREEAPTSTHDLLKAGLASIGMK
jgi:hypothetical protein